MESGKGGKPPDQQGPGYGPGSPGYGPGGDPPERSPAEPRSPGAPGSPSGPQSPAGPGSPSGPQSPQPSESEPPSTFAPPAAPRGPESPAPGGPQSPAPGGAPRYGGPVPPGGWQQPLAGRGPAPPLGELATWGSRLGAYFIDGLVLLVPLGILFVLIVGGAVGISGDDDDVAVGAVIGALILFAVVAAVVVLLYAPLLMIRKGERNGQTWGKQIVGIRAVRDSGEPWTFGSAALREVVLKNLAVGVASSVIPIIPWFLNFFWPLWDDQNRALHDMAASSHVVRA